MGFPGFFPGVFFYDPKHSRLFAKAQDSGEPRGLLPGHIGHHAALHLRAERLAFFFKGFSRVS